MTREAGGKQILIVDDDTNIRRFLSESLRLRGYQVQSFAAAEPALAALEAERFDLALLDILLPGTNGLQLCRQLRQRPACGNLPVIMMTAFYKQADHIREAREQYGATDYLLKPFPLRTLHEKIADLIGKPAPTDAGDRLSIEGDLRETPLPRILHNLYSLQTTGLLHLEHGEIKKVVYIRNGYPIFVRSNLVREFLGQILIRRNMLSEEDLARSLDHARNTGQRHGTALIELGFLTPRQLNDVLRKQVVDKLLDIFAWPEGSYRFLQVREFKQGVTSIDLSPANLILQGLRQHAAREQIGKILDPHRDHYLQLAENPRYRFQEIQLSDSERQLIAQCQGRQTLGQLLERHRLSRKAAEPLFAALLCTGILIGRPEAESDVASPACDDESPELRARREEFLKDYGWMMAQDYFTLLGVTETDSRDLVRKSYYGLVKKYHPDRFFEQDLLLDLKDQVNALFQRISDAHETLTDATAKARYINDLKGLSGKPKANFENIIQAETAFQKGLVLFRTRKYDQALAAFDEALALGPEEPEYLMYQAWTFYKAAPHDRNRVDQARQKLQRVVQRNPRLGPAHLYLGYLHKAEGNLKEAQRRFERAIQYNPDCTEALRELRLMSLRREKAEKEKKGLLGKMFGK